MSILQVAVRRVSEGRRAGLAGDNLVNATWSGRAPLVPAGRTTDRFAAFGGPPEGGDYMVSKALYNERSHPMRYMMFIKHTEDYANVQVPPGLYEAMGAFVEQSQKDGTFIDGAGLQPTKAAHRVRLKNGKITVTDGPFTESKEIVGGYALIEARSEAHALDIAQRFMDIHRVHWPTFEGECEVRPLEAEAQEQK